MTPLAIDLFCGLGGWTEGLLEEGYRVVGFDIERHVYGEARYPAQLVLQDVLTIHVKATGEVSPHWRTDGTDSIAHCEGYGQKNTGGSWFNVAHNTTSGHSRNPVNGTKGGNWFGNYQEMKDGIKQGGDWFNDSQPSISRMCSSKSSARKAASAHIAKIPYELARHIARCWLP